MTERLDECMTEFRQELIAQGVRWTNAWIEKVQKENGHIFERKSPLLQAQDVRGWLIAYVAEALSADESTLQRAPFNIDGIQIDEKYFLRLKKLASPEVFPEETPKLREARLERLQHSIFPEAEEEAQLSMFDAEEEAPLVRELPLSNLEHLTIGYSTDQVVTRIFVMDVDYTMERVVDFIEIDISSGADTSEVAPVAPPEVGSRTQFVAKRNQADEESKTA